MPMVRAAYAKLTSRLWGTSLVYLAGRAIPAALGMVGVTLFVRILGEVVYGQYALVSGVAILVGSVGATWLAQSLLRYRAAYEGGTFGRVFDSTLRVATWGSAGAAVLVLVGVLVGRGTPLVGLVSSVVAAGALLHFTVVYARYQSALRPGRILVAEVIRGVLTLAVPVALIIGIGWRHYAPLLLGLAAGNAGGAWFLSGGVPTGTLRAGPRERALLRRMAGFGVPLAVWVGLSMLLSLSDRFVIERALGSGAVGTYAAVYDVVYKASNLLLTPILLAAHPLIMNAWNAGERGKAHRLVERTVALTLGVAGPMVAGWWALSGPVTRLVLGYPSAPAARLVGPIALGAVVWLVATVVHKQLEMRSRTWVLCVFAATALGVQVALNLALLPRFGLVVAPWSMTAAAALYLALVYLTGRWIDVREVTLTEPVPDAL